MNKLIKFTGLFILGGLSYGLIEIMWRGYTHWSMLLAGGICFLIMFIIYSRHKNLRIIERFLIGSAIITTVELILGLVLNYYLNMHIWDYSNLRFNILGQVSLLYSLLWGLLSIPVSFLCIRIDNFLTSAAQTQTEQSLGER